MRLRWERNPQSPEAEQPKRVTFAVLGDTHGGHKLGLLNPDVKLYDEAPDGALVEYTPQPTAAQVELWQLHIHHLDQLQEIASGGDIVGLHNGDATWGNKYPYQLVSTRMSAQIEIAAANLTPLVEIPNLKVMRLSFST